MARRKQTQNREIKPIETKPQIDTRSHTLKLRIDDLKTVEPLTESQSLFFEDWRHEEEFIGMFGSAGTGKTFLSMYKGLETVMDKGNDFKKLVVIRSSVQVRDIGHTPGSIDEKMAIFEAPYIDIAASLFGRGDAWSRLKEQGVAKFVPTTAIRGVTFDNSIILVDECQSMTFHELSSIITRCGENSRIIFVGDLAQNDLLKSKHDVSGLRVFIRVAQNIPNFCLIEFTSEDIVRSALVKAWIISCEQLGV